jgi:hypothetical protein
MRRDFVPIVGPEEPIVLQGVYALQPLQSSVNVRILLILGWAALFPGPGLRLEPRMAQSESTLVALPDQKSQHGFWCAVSGAYTAALQIFRQVAK